MSFGSQGLQREKCQQRISQPCRYETVKRKVDKEVHKTLVRIRINTYPIYHLQS